MSEVGLDPSARCERLVEAGRALRERPLSEILDVLDEVGRRWADPSDPARREAESAMGDRHGVPREPIRRILDAGFVTPDGTPRYAAEALRAWIEAEVGDAEALDRWSTVAGRARRAFGPRLLVALASRGVPTTPVEDVVAALCVKAPVWLKPATGSDDLVVRFLATIAEADSGIGRAVEAARWSASGPDAGTILGRAEVVAATGRETTLQDVRGALGEGTRLLAHGPRLSIAVAERERLDDVDGLAAAIADDAALAGQVGCLSPVVVYVVARPAEVESLVEPLWRACERRWPAPVRRATPPEERARWGEWIALAGVERAAGSGGSFAGGPDDAWSVQAVTRAAPPDPPPIPRMVTIAPVEDLGQVAELCARRRGLLATVGFASGREGEATSWAESLARAGVERIAPVGTMQRPPLGWRRDGRTTLADLVRWVDREA